MPGTTYNLSEAFLELKSWWGLLTFAQQRIGPDAGKTVMLDAGLLVDQVANDWRLDGERTALTTHTDSQKKTTGNQVALGGACVVAISPSRPPSPSPSPPMPADGTVNPGSPETTRAELDRSGQVICSSVFTSNLS